MNIEYFNMAIEEAKKGVKNRDGGPFGAIVVKDNEIIGVGHNRVLGSHDPTAHAEVMAIRNACEKLKTHDLTGCVIYTTSEPCPMCLSAIIWANIKEVYYGTDRKEVGNIGFRDDKIYEYFQKGEKNLLTLEHVKNQKCIELLNEYKNTIY